MRILLLLFPALLVGADPGDECFRFYYGPGKDLARARVCFEAAMPKLPCTGGSSPDLARLYLAVMYADAQGGPVNYASARSLFNGCFADIGVTTVLKDVAARESGKEAANGKLDFCRDIGGSTLTALQCNAMKGASGSEELTGVLREARARLDPAGAALFDADQKAWTAFVTADGARTFDEYRGGTLAPVAEGENRVARTQARVARLKAFANYHPSAAAGDADAALNAAYRKAMKAADAQHRKLLTAAERAWIVYRDAEAALYGEHFGKQFGREAVEADVKAMLSRERAKELALPAGH